jgi:hypothetical protein
MTKIVKESLGNARGFRFEREGNPLEKMKIGQSHDQEIIDNTPWRIRVIPGLWDAVKLIKGYKEPILIIKNMEDKTYLATTEDDCSSGHDNPEEALESLLKKYPLLKK